MSKARREARQAQRRKNRAKRNSSSQHQPSRRRRVFINFALVMGFIMALSLVLASYTHKASTGTSFESTSASSAKEPKTESKTRQPASANTNQGWPF